jgi:threonine dehydratase
MTQPATEALTQKPSMRRTGALRRSCTVTPLLHSTSHSDETGYDVWLKAEIFQRTGSYRVRGPSNKLPQLSREEQRADVIYSSAGNHAQGVA